MIYLLVASVVWAFSFGLIKHKLVSLGLDAAVLSFLRLLLSFIVFVPFVRFRSVSGRVAFRLMIVGAVQYGLMYLYYMHSYHYLAAYQVAVFTIFTPIYVTLINDLSKKRFSKMFLLAALLGVVGAGIIVYEGKDVRGVLTGFLLLQVSNICFAIGQVFYKSIKATISDVRDSNVFGFLYLGAVLVAAVPASIGFSFSGFEVDGSQLLTLLYLGVVPSGLCFFLWNVGATKVNTGNLAVMNNAKIPLAILFSLIVFHEAVNLPRLMVGGIVLVAAVMLSRGVSRERC